MHKLTRAQQIKFTNCTVGLHDCLCDCDKPALHSATILLKQLAPELLQEEKDHLKRCLGTTTGPVEEECGVTGEDLEKLFAEDTGEDLDG